MAAITFDTLKFTKRLIQAGAAPELAEATAEAFKDAQSESEVAIKANIKRLEIRLHSELRGTNTKIDSLASKLTMFQ